MLQEAYSQAKQWTEIKIICDQAISLLKSWQKDEIANSGPVIFPEGCKIVNIMFGEEHEKDIAEILMSHNTVSWRIQDMSQDGEW